VRFRTRSPVPPVMLPLSHVEVALKRPLRFPCRWLAAVALVLTLASASSSQKVLIDINDPRVRRLSLAVPELKRGEGEPVANLPAVIAETLRSDLSSSGLFDLIDPKAFLEDPQEGPVVPDAGSFETWLTTGAELLIKGRVSRDRDQISVELRAFDVFRRAQLFGKRYTSSAAEARTVGHLFANAVLEEFTGIPGPFGTRIAYVVQRGKTKELGVAESDGANPRVITRSGSLSLGPSWSRDARYLYFTSYLLGKPDLYLLDLTNWKTWIVSRAQGINLSGKDSPDGKEILLSLSKDGNPEIYRMDKSTRALVRLTEHSGIDVAPTWSPDGKQIAFVSDRTGTPQIYVMGRDGGRVKRLTFSGGHNGDPDWSPKGDLIAFTGRDEKGMFQVHTIDSEGRDLRRVTTGPYDTMDPSWSPDGRFLAVTSNRQGKDAVYTVRLGSQDFRRVSPPGEEASQPAWAPRAPGS
jgi:TolB protein